MNTREALIREHIIHEFDRTLAVNNITGCYGALSEAFYHTMIGFLRGRRILDVGCGLGLFGKVCAEHGFEVHSIDIDELSLEIARELFGPAYYKESGYSTSLPDGAIDTAWLSDVACHLDFGALTKELDRLSVNRVIIVESNLRNPLLTVYRRLTGHHEKQDFLDDDLTAVMRGRGFSMSHKFYCNVVALPLSGGLQRKPVPVIGNFPRLIRGLDRMVERLVRVAGLERYLSFRFVLILDRDE